MGQTLAEPVPEPVVESARVSRSGRWVSAGRKVFWGLVYVALLILGWGLVVAAFEIRPYLIPAPVGVGQALAESGGFIVRHTLITLFEALVGFGLAAVVGVLLAVVIVYAPIIRSFLLPTLVAVNATPKVAIAPVLVIWLGLGLESKYAMAFLLSFFPIVINTARGLADVPPELLNYFRLMRASGYQTFMKARLPNSLPSMFDGFKIALPIAVIGAIIGEFVAAREGIGFQILRAYSRLDTELVFGMVIIVAVISTILFQLLIWIERRVLSWRPTTET
jgi:NitT/TauT family transport system permease protein